MVQSELKDFVLHFHNQVLPMDYAGGLYHTDLTLCILDKLLNCTIKHSVKCRKC